MADFRTGIYFLHFTSRRCWVRMQGDDAMNAEQVTSRAQESAERYNRLVHAQAEQRASGNFTTKADLDRIVVLWRKPDCLSLYGIPYAMREGCGQTPKHLWDARDADYRRSPLDTTRRVTLDDWIWLGSPGWWGSMLPEERTAVEVWLAPLYTLDLVPRNVCDFIDLRKEFRGQTYDEAIWGKRPTAKVHPTTGQFVIPGIGFDELAIVRI